jgi:hypothetical protein
MFFSDSDDVLIGFFTAAFILSISVSRVIGAEEKSRSKVPTLSGRS